MLVIELSGRYVDGPVPLLSRLRGEPVQSLLTLTSELRKAARDTRLDARRLPRARARASAGRRRRRSARRSGGSAEKGRRTVAVLEIEGFGNAPLLRRERGRQRRRDAGGGNAPFVGLAAEYLFFGGLFEKLGVDVEYERVGEYKSAVESYAETQDVRRESRR